MAQSRRSTRSRKSTRARSRRHSEGRDAISLLKADHDEVKKWFGEFEKTRSDARKQEVMQGGDASKSGERAENTSNRRGRGKIAALLGPDGKGRDARHRAG